MRATFLALAVAAVAIADESTTIGLFNANVDDVSSMAIPSYTSIAGSIVSVNAYETTIAVSCLDGAATESCSIKDPWTIVQAISTFSLSAVYTAFDWNPPVTATLDYDCTYQDYTVSGSCRYSMTYSGSSDGTEMTSSFSTEISSIPTDSVTYVALDVTGGLDKFDEPEATETPGAAAAFAGPMQAVITAAPVLVAGVVAML
ncbi:hypothetical protein BDV12DRAFT_179325 [Aspergillus spectabilis]